MSNNKGIPKTKGAYNKQLLQELCVRDECIVDFTKIEKYNITIKIDFTCKCGNKHNKTFKQIYKAGGYCKICTESKRKEKVKQTCIKRYNVVNPLEIRKVYNKQLLQELCVRDECIVDFTKIEKYNRDIKVDFTCKCGNKHNKTFIQIYKACGYCKICTESKRKEKAKQSCIKRYNVVNPSQLQEVKDKKKQTCLDNFGVLHPFQSQEVRDKSKQTCLERYNVGNPMQDAELSEKASKKSYNLKEFHFICGNIIQVQGYEPFLLDILVKEGYTFEDILIKRQDVPEIWYEKNNKKSRYFCDAYIPQTNTIYEVKSTWTYERNIEVNLLKKQACIDAGFNFELYIFDGKRNRIDENLFKLS